MLRLACLAVLAAALLAGCASPAKVERDGPAYPARSAAAAVQVFLHADRAPPYIQIGTVDTIVESSNLGVWYPAEHCMARAVDAARAAGGKLVVLLEGDVDEITREIYQESHIHVTVRRYRWAIGVHVEESAPEPAMPDLPLGFVPFDGS